MVSLESWLSELPQLSPAHMPNGVSGFMRHKVVVKLERAGGADDKLGFLCSEDRKWRYDVPSKKKLGVTTGNRQKWEVEYQVD